MWRGEVGLVGRTLSFTTWRSLDATVSPSATREFPVSSRSSLGTCFSFSTSCPLCNMLLLYNNPVPLTNFAIGKFSSSFVGALECNAFVWCATQCWMLGPSSLIQNPRTALASSNYPCVFTLLVTTPSILLQLYS
jgi:hypothetical protein